MSNLVCVCTPTYNRRFSLEFSVECYKKQSYKNLHWIIVDNSTSDDNSWKDIQQIEGIQVTYIRILEKKPIGSLRNVCLEEARKLNPEFIAFWDDDDFYPPQRIEKSVQALQQNPGHQIIGVDIMTVFLSHENVLLNVGPYGPNHSTAACYLFRNNADTQARYFEANAVKAEEGAFTRDWTMPMLMLPADDILLVIGHANNTVNKSNIFADPKKYGARVLNSDNAKNIVRFQWIKDPSTWKVFCKTFLGA